MMTSLEESEPRSIATETELAMTRSTFFEDGGIVEEWHADYPEVVRYNGVRYRVVFLHGSWMRMRRA